MKPQDPIKLVSQVRDLQIMDVDGLRCGIADDIEFEGEPGEPLRVACLVVGLGAYEPRLPRWAFAVMRMFAACPVVRIPWQQVDTIDSIIRLKVTAKSLGLRHIEDRLSRYLSKIPFS